MDYTALKIKVGFGPHEGVNKDGKVKHEASGHIFPQFNLLPPEARGGVAGDPKSGMDWCNYIDKFGNGVINDCCGHSDARSGPMASAYGEWYVGCIVPPDFAAAAIAMFPGEVEACDEAKWQMWHDDAFMARSPDVRLDNDVLQAIEARRRLQPTARPTQDEQDALDPDKEVPGIRKNKSRRWADVKARIGANLVMPQ